MKFSKLCLFLVIIALISCGREEESISTTLDLLQNEWYYMSSTGAEGPQCFYEKGEMIYSFSTSKLTVEDNYQLEGICNSSFKAEGQYDYEVKLVDGMEYLIIDDVDEGRIRFEGQALIIDNGFRSDGTIIDDLPTYRLEL